MSASASRAKASPACSADTVPERMRVPIRNICSCAKMRMRSRKSSYDPAWRSERSRAAASERALECAVASRAPAPHQSGGLQRATKAQFGQSVESFAIVRLRWKKQCPATGLDDGRILEQRRIVALHIAQMTEQGMRKGV